jgi:RNA polymerase sigma factor (sigma-70 family)
MHAESDRRQESSIAVKVELFRGGDAYAAEELARHSMRLALRTAAAIVGNREEASDIAQDVAVDVLRSVGKLRDPEAFNAWVHRITARHALRWLKRRRRAHEAEIPLALITETEEPEAGEGIDRETAIAARHVLAVALAELPPRQRIALALRYVHDLSDEEIAAALDCRIGSVHSLLSRARNALRNDTRLAEFALGLKEVDDVHP